MHALTVSIEGHGQWLAQGIPALQRIPSIFLKCVCDPVLSHQVEIKIFARDPTSMACNAGDKYNAKQHLSFQ